MPHLYGYHGSSVGAVAIQIAGLKEMIAAQGKQIAALNKELRQAHIKNAALLKENDKLKRDTRNASANIDKRDRSNASR